METLQPRLRDHVSLQAALVMFALLTGCGAPTTSSSTSTWSSEIGSPGPSAAGSATASEAGTLVIRGRIVTMDQPSIATPTLPPGITGWTTYTSEVHGFTVGYPADWSVNAPATRNWQIGDDFPADELPYADTFVSPDQEAVGLFVWEMPVGEGADVESLQGLKAWAETFCNDVGASACDTFTQGAVPMCLALVADPDVVLCDAALLVPTAEAQYAFFADRGSRIFTNIPDVVTVVVVARADSFPSAAGYGGSVELLKAILTTMKPDPVRTPTPGQVVGKPPE